MRRQLQRFITPVRTRLVQAPAIARWARRRREREVVAGGRIHAGRAPVTSALTITPDYLDAFTITTQFVASPREWMIACFERGLERSGRDLIFERILALNTTSDGAPGTVAGWCVVGEDDRSLTIAANGTRVEVNLVMERVEDGMRLLTAVHDHSRIGYLLWRILSQVHRRLAPGVLRTGAAILRGDHESEPRGD
ncbi:hypothetical protein EK0264_02310 [Epidermidibacterium keratini]|uniref:DUF2867 domain-containing protein n=1 Tax=Epidermidibacterium keratini TaxID=1891644 RepID=A0A7L4YIY8_9ACTN|nr:hypothetical protein [Epidermidibacterium keratini]QHB99235.1 hypothetical protein EK0264_02310 [Epidermidibacterium keratini]